MRAFRIILTLLILAGVAVLCVVRWDAWFTNPPEPQWTGDTITYSFHTFGDDSVPGFEYNGIAWEDLREPDTLRILLFGDVHNSLTHAQWEAVANRHPQTDCYAQLGDFVERGYFYYNQKLYHDLQGTAFDSLPLINVPGNHEYRKGIRRTLPDYWTETFRHPHNGPLGFDGTTYFVDFEDLRLIAINTNGLQHIHEMTRVNTWLKKTIQTAGDRFVMVIMHHPVHSCGAGRQNIHIAATFIRALDNVDIIFAGHDHNYSRRLPYVNTNSATKFYLHKLGKRDSRVASGVQLYEDIALYGDTLRMQTRLLDSGDIYDEVLIVRHGDSKEIIESIPATPEIINIPQKYINSDKRKVQRFHSRREKRLNPAPVVSLPDTVR